MYEIVLTPQDVNTAEFLIASPTSSHLKNAGSNASEFNKNRLASIVRSVYTAWQEDSTVTAERSSPQTSVEDELRSRFQTPLRHVLTSVKVLTCLHDSCSSQKGWS